jgi:hypothetical protein
VPDEFLRKVKRVALGHVPGLEQPAAEAGLHAVHGIARRCLLSLRIQKLFMRDNTSGKRRMQLNQSADVIDGGDLNGIARLNERFAQRRFAAQKSAATYKTPVTDEAGLNAFAFQQRNDG